MRIVYLRSATGGLRWLRSYYGQVFPEEATKAREAVRGMERLVLDNPFIGAPCTAPKCADCGSPATRSLSSTANARARRDPARSRRTQAGRYG